MTSEKQFYVYVHRKTTDGSVFYVGKGKGRRAFSSHSRSKYWSNVANKYGFTAHIVMRFDRKECAYSFERVLIKFYGRDNLCNLTDGGEGGVGAKPGPLNYWYGKCGPSHHRYGTTHSDEVRNRISLGLAGKNTHTGNKYRSGKKWNDGQRKLVSLLFSGAGNPSYKKEIHTFKNKDGTIYVGTMHNFCAEYSMHKGNVSLMMNGKIKTTKGWSLAC